jgi:hypothetical protein
MRQVLLLAIVAGLVFVSVATADVPLPPDVKYVTPRVRFEGVDKYAEHVFFLKYNAGPGNPLAAPPTIVEVKNTEPFEMTGGRRLANVHLFAVPRTDVAKLREKDPKMGWLSDSTPGVLKAPLTPPSTTASIKLKEVPITSYRVVIEEAKLKVELVPAENKRGEAPTNRLPTVVAASAAGLSLAIFGVWFARRRASPVA